MNVRSSEGWYHAMKQTILIVLPTKQRDRHKNGHDGRDGCKLFFFNVPRPLLHENGPPVAVLRREQHLDSLIKKVV